MNIALILSGGTGQRLVADTPKQYHLLLGKPVIVYTMEQFQRRDDIRYLFVTATHEWKEQILRWKDDYHLTKLCAVAPAGRDRQLSICSGLLAAKPFMTGIRDNVIIQDAVRPLTSPALITRLLAGLQEAPSVMPVLPVTDTTYTSQDGQWADGLLERSALYGGQAPEAFHYHPYLHLYEETPPEELSAMSGSCQLPYKAGWNVKMVPGEQENIKITYPLDLKVCEMLLREREGIS